MFKQYVLDALEPGGYEGTVFSWQTVLLASSSDRPRPVAPLFPDMPCMKRFTETNRRRHTGQQPGTKSARGPVDQPLINRGSTAGQPRVNRGSTADFVPPSVYIRFRLFVLPKRRPGQCLRFARGQEGGLSPGRIDPTASRRTQPRTPSPPRRAPPRPDRPIVCPGFAYDKCVLSRPVRGMFGFWIRQCIERKHQPYVKVFIAGMPHKTCRNQNANIPQVDYAQQSVARRLITQTLNSSGLQPIHRSAQLATVHHALEKYRGYCPKREQPENIFKKSKPSLTNQTKTRTYNCRLGRGAGRSCGAGLGRTGRRQNRSSRYKHPSYALRLR